MRAKVIIEAKAAKQAAISREKKTGDYPPQIDHSKNQWPNKFASCKPKSNEGSRPPRK